MKNDKDIVGVWVGELDKIDRGDTEIAHISADECLIKALEELGLADLSSAWERVSERSGGFWYA
jgi:hypothetical protein